MKISKNYDPNVNSEWTPLAAGGHKCVIKQVESAGVDRWGNKALVISFDTADDDTQPKYFSNQYLKSTQENKTWRGVKAYAIENNDNYEKQQNKFLAAVQASNEGVDFSGKAEVSDESFKGLKVGVVFQVKRYTKADHSIGATVDPYYFCNYDTAFEQKVPKENDRTKQNEAPTDFGFVNVAEDDESGLPFK